MRSAESDRGHPPLLRFDVAKMNQEIPGRWRSSGGVLGHALSNDGLQVLGNVVIEMAHGSRFGVQDQVNGLAARGAGEGEAAVVVSYITTPKLKTFGPKIDVAA